MKDILPNGQMQAHSIKPEIIGIQDTEQVELSNMNVEQKAELKIGLEAKYSDPIGLAKKLRVVIGYMDKLYPDLKKMKRRSEILDFISNAMTGQREFLSMVGLIYGIEALETEEEKIQREKREAAQKD